MKRLPPQEEALAAMLVPLARVLLRYNFSVGDLSHAAKRAFVEAGITEVRAEGQKPNISRLAVLTGLTRKEVSAIVKARKAKRSHDAKRTMKQRALRVLQGWRLDPRFTDENGRPAKLPMYGGTADFRALVRKYGGDVTPVAVLRELQRTRWVSLDQSANVRFTAFRNKKKLNPQFVELAQLIRDFVGSVNQNVQGAQASLFRGFREAIVQTSDQAALFKRTFARRGVALLDGVPDWAASQKKTPGRRERGRTAGTRVGVGVYLVESDNQKDIAGS